MSRGVRDLRELICVSRLSMVESDDDDDDDRVSNNTLSDESGIERDHRNHSLTELSLQSGCASCSSSESPTGLLKRSRNKKIKPKNKSNKDVHSHNYVTGQFVDKNSNATKGSVIERNSLNSESKCKASQVKEKSTKTTNGISCQPNQFPTSSPLRSVGTFPTEYEHVGKKLGSRPPWMQREGGVVHQEVLESRSRLDDLCDEAEPETAATEKGLAYADRNYDELLTGIEPDVLSVWLEQANKDVQELDKWCHTGDNFVQLAHAWLSCVSDAEKSTIVECEHAELVRKLHVTFPSKSGSQKVTQNDIYSFLGAVFREYPTRMLGAKGAHLFLDYLDVLSSDKRESYRMLLSDVKCWTLQPQHAQWILAIRSFALVSVWMAIVGFVRKRLDASPATRCSSRTGATSRMETSHLKSSTDPTKSVNSQRMYQAIRSGYIDVIQYFLQSGNITPKTRDAQDRSLVFYSVIYNQPRVLHFLISQMSQAIDVNGIADSGNSALHAAANTGNTDLVRELLCAKNINVNVQNSSCDNATPLHLAVMHGHSDVVRLLLASGADPLLNMGSTTAIDLAMDFDHSEIIDMLKQFKR